MSYKFFGAHEKVVKEMKCCEYGLRALFPSKYLHLTGKARMEHHQVLLFKLDLIQIVDLVLNVSLDKALKLVDRQYSRPCKEFLKYNIFVQWAFLLNITSDTVTLTNFVKNFNFCGGLYFDSLVAKPLSNLYYDSRCNFQQSNN